MADTSPLVVLLLQCAGILVGTFLCGVIPLYLSLSKTKLRILEVLGAGLLVGASMTVVLPEGVAAIYQPTSPEGHDDGTHHRTAAWAWSRLERKADSALPGTLRERPFDPEAAVGIALLSGFLIMFLIDQIASPGAHVHAHPQGPDREAHGHWHGPSHRPEALRLTRASSLAIPKNTATSVGPMNGGDASDGAHHHLVDSSLEGSPEQMPADHDDVPHSQAPLLRRESGGTSSASGRPRKPSDAGSHNSSGVIHSRSMRNAFASIAGLIIHAAADGIAMGASAGSGDESLKLVVLLAIMIHKAPASFGLCTLLMGQRLHKSDIRRAVAIFSMSTPFGALTTYLFLSLILNPGADGSAISPHHIGTALTLSAGTFLFVAMHAVQELTSADADLDLDEGHHHHHHHVHHSGQGAPHGHAHEQRAAGAHPGATSSPPRQILGRTGRVAVFVLGTILPKVLQGLVGHHH